MTKTLFDFNAPKAWAFVFSAGAAWLAFLFYFSSPVTPKVANEVAAAVVKEDPAFTVHLVERGEYLTTIANRYGISWRDLAKLNGISNPNVLEVGSEIRIPKTQVGVVEGYIKTLDPDMDDARALELAKHFLIVCTRAGADPRVFVAIAFQENRFRASGINGNDIGMLQLNYYWQFVRPGLVDKYTIEEINTNWKLNSEFGAKYLAKCQKDSSHEDGLPAWTCYNNAKDTVHRKAYFDRVNPYLEKL